MGLLTKTKVIPASATYKELENTVLPAGTSAYQQLANRPMQTLTEAQSQGLFGNPELYAYQQATNKAVSPIGVLAGLTDPQKSAIEQMSLGSAGYSDLFSGDLFQDYLNKYQNPYQEQVINPTLENIRQQSDIARSRLGEEATAAGGFGGTRQALENSLIEAETQKNIANVGSQLRSQGLSSAMDRAFQDYLAGQNIYQQGMQTQMNAGNILQQQNQSGLNAANQQITQPAEWYQQFLKSMPEAMIRPEQKVQVGTGLSKALGAVSSVGGLVSGLGGFGGIGQMFGLGNSSGSGELPIRYGSNSLEPTYGYSNNYFNRY